MAEQRHLCPAGCGSICKRVQIVFYTVHVTVRIENHRLIEARQAVQRLQRTVIAVAGHGVHPQMREKGQRLFQIPQAVPKKITASTLFCSLFKMRLMASRAPWLSLRTSSFVTEKYPPLYSFGSLLQQQQLLVNFALGIGCALCSSLGGGRSAEALNGQRKARCAACSRVSSSSSAAPAGAPAITSTYSPRGSAAR